VLRFIASRLLQAVPTLFVLVTLTFFMLRAVPGGPFAGEKAVSEEVLRQLEAHYGLNKPLLVQYTDYLGALLHGDFGPSFTDPTRTVSEIIAERLPVSLELGAWAMLVALVAGLSAGVVASIRPNSALDHTVSALSLAGLCVPTFVIGPLLVLVLSIMLGWFNTSGWYGPLDRVLPALTLGGVYAATIARLTRAGMREMLSQDFIRTARAKGASELRIVVRHALKGGLLPVVTYLGPALAGILTGSFVVETIFQIPGLGRVFVNSALGRDYTVVTGTVILYATLIIGFNLVVDVVAAWLNPRLRLT
jgi:oligopeptide transport system permease protein